MSPLPPTPPCPWPGLTEKAAPFPSPLPRDLQLGPRAPFPLPLPLPLLKTLTVVSAGLSSSPDSAMGTPASVSPFGEWGSSPVTVLLLLAPRLLLSEGHLPTPPSMAPFLPCPQLPLRCRSRVRVRVSIVLDHSRLLSKHPGSSSPDHFLCGLSLRDLPEVIQLQVGAWAWALGLANTSPWGHP